MIKSIFFRVKYKFNSNAQTRHILPCQRYFVNSTTLQVAISATQRSQISIALVSDNNNIEDVA